MPTPLSPDLSALIHELKLTGKWHLIEEELEDMKAKLDRTRRAVGICNDTPKNDFRYKLGALDCLDEVLSWEKKANYPARNKN